jgi:hypothetical protein
MPYDQKVPAVAFAALHLSTDHFALYLYEVGRKEGSFRNYKRDNCFSP